MVEACQGEGRQGRLELRGLLRLGLGVLLWERNSNKMKPVIKRTSSSRAFVARRRGRGGSSEQE